MAHQRARGIGHVYISPLDVMLTSEDVLQPDIFHLPDGSRARDRIDCAPDLVVEVVLPTSRVHDVKEKLEIYGTTGVLEAWYVDLDAEKIELYRFADDLKKPAKIFIRGEVLASPLFPEFRPGIDAIIDSDL